MHRRVGRRKKVLAGKKEAKVGEPSQGDEEFMDLHGGNIYQLPVALDFSVNVNPLGPPVEIRRSLTRPEDWLSCYPKLDHSEDEKKLLQFLGFSKVREVSDRWGMQNSADAAILERDRLEVRALLGSGASELLMTYVLVKRPRRILLAEPSFYGYRHAARAIGAEILSYPLREEEDFLLDEGFLEQIDLKPDLILLANPNNPNGKQIREKVLEKILKKAARHQIPVILDLCFLPLHLLLYGDAVCENPDIQDKPALLSAVLSDQESSQESTAVALRGQRVYAALLKRYFAWHGGLLLLGAFTKTFAIPSLRLGYLLGKKENLSEIRRGLPEWNLSMPAQIALEELFALEGNGGLAAYFQETGQMLARESRYLRKSLSRLGFRVYGGEANFILFADLAEREWDQKGISPGKTSLCQALMEEKVLIRDCGNYQNLGRGYYRIAVLSHEKNQTLIRLLDKIRREREKGPVQA